MHQFLPYAWFQGRCIPFEEAKVSIRNIRRDANKAADQAEKAKEVSEDERDDIKSEVQELTKKYEAVATDHSKAREKEVLDD